MSAAKVIKRVLAAAPMVLADIAGTVGAGLIAYGAWLAWPPAGFVVGGLQLMAAAVLYLRGRG